MLKNIYYNNSWHKKKFWRWSVIVSVSLFTGPCLSAADSSSSEYAASVQPILKQYCFGCHGPNKQRGDLRLDTTNPDMINGIDGEVWHDVLHHIQRGEMPPEDKPQLSSTERATLITWLQTSFKYAAEKRKPTGRPNLRRLTREEYANTMRDLIGIDLDYAGTLPSDPISPDGFTNNGASLGFSPMHLEYLLDTARMALDKAIVEGPKPNVFENKKIKNHFKPIWPKEFGKIDPKYIFASTAYEGQVKEYPREGDFTITAKVDVVVPSGAAAARILATVGYKAGQGFVSKPIGEYTIASSGQHELTWTGRLERMSLPEANSKANQLVIHINHMPVDGSDFTFEIIGGGGYKVLSGKSNTPPDPKKSTHFIMQELKFTAPAITTWPPPAHTRILFDPPNGVSDKQYAHDVIKKFTQRAFRRTVNDSEIAPFMEFYNQALQITKSDISAMRETLAMVLVSPDFLYLVQPNMAKIESRPLTNEEIANRLSYFLWGSMPDDVLLNAARNKQLSNVELIASQARRLLQDKKSEFFTTNFVDQWLELSGLERIAINPSYYPDFQDYLKEYMREETRLLFSDTVHNNVSVMNLINADYTFLNKSLADHYGIVGPKGHQFERVTLRPKDKRGGLLGHGSIHLIGSNGEDSHPIRRAVWVRDRLLNDPPAPPPPNVPGLDEENPDMTRLSVKQQLELHSKKESCHDCHKSLDPWGIPFEHYDAVGQWRDQVKRLVAHSDSENEKKSKKGKKDEPNFVFAEIEDSAVLPGNKPVTGIDGLRQHLLKHEQSRFAENMVRRLTTYAIGRSLTFDDQPAVDALAKQFAGNGYRLGDLIISITTSKLFLHQ